ncbi:hepatic lectin-like [Patiria miniata]|uniref:C-type lectin domain-containing protein n=1 Tax=Patiria miniata TaxID=46514 RepID=A0A914AHK8_PATMI|nr:hepatic lectin-like [Patiria miniata]
MSAMTFVWLSVLLVCVQANCKWQFGNSCYQLLTETMTFDKALQACSAMGGGLVVPNSKNENQFIWEEIASNLMTDGRVWIGCIDKDKQGKWMYAADAGKRCKFDGWSPGEPNVPIILAEECAQMWGFHSGKWVDIQCRELASVICEYYSSLDVTCRQADADGRFA